jgi:hypothetical protein
MLTASDLPALHVAIRQAIPAVREVDPDAVCEPDPASPSGPQRLSAEGRVDVDKARDLLFLSRGWYFNRENPIDPSLPFPIRKVILGLSEAVMWWYLTPCEECKQDLLVCLEEAAEVLQSRRATGIPGRPLRYSLEIWKYGRELIAQSSPRLTIKQIMAKCREQFPGQRLPKKEGAFREWLKAAKKKAR